MTNRTHDDFRFTPTVIEKLMNFPCTEPFYDDTTITEGEVGQYGTWTPDDFHTEALHVKAHNPVLSERLTVIGRVLTLGEYPRLQDASEDLAWSEAIATAQDGHRSVNYLVTATGEGRVRAAVSRTFILDSTAR